MRERVKCFGRMLALCGALPFYLCFRLTGMLLGPAIAFEDMSQAISLLPGTMGAYIRRAFYARTLAECSQTCVISFGALFSDQRARVGENVYIGPRCDIGYAILEDDVLLGSGVHILSGKRQHFIDDLTRPIRVQGGEMQKVRVGSGAWVGNGAILMADVGRHTVVGAGAVVTADTEAYVIVGGNPARVIRERVHGANR
jgi:virginiamycin A acetyltransferase